RLPDRGSPPPACHDSSSSGVARPPTLPRGELTWRRIDKVSLDDVARAPCPCVAAAHQIARWRAQEWRVPLGSAPRRRYAVELRLSEDAAYKRIQAARVARQFPGIFEAVADGRLHLTAVGLLAPYLTPKNAAELLAAAALKTKSEIEELLARRFPRSETLGLVAALPGSSPQLAPAQVEAPGRPDFPGTGDRELAPAQVHPRSKLAPVARERFLLQVTIGR